MSFFFDRNANAVSRRWRIRWRGGDGDASWKREVEVDCPLSGEKRRETEARNAYLALVPYYN